MISRACGNPVHSMKVFNSLHAGYFCMLLCHLLKFFKINFFHIFLGIPSEFQIVLI